MKIEKDGSGYPNRVSLEVELRHAPEYPTSAFMVFDFDPVEIFGTKARVPVVLTIDGKKFRRSLARYAGELMLVFNAELREATGYKAGDRIQVLIERDFEPRVVELPQDVAQALKAAKLLDKWQTWSYSHQREDLAWIEEAKRPETRQKRIAKLLEVLAG